MSRWFLAEIVSGLPVTGWESGHHAYVRVAGDKVQVRGKGGLRAVVKIDEARRRLRTVRKADGSPVAVARQERWSEEWTARTAAA